MTELDIDNLSDEEREHIEDIQVARLQGQFGLLMWLHKNQYLSSVQVKAIADEKGIPLK